ncbi:MAG: D-alanyl-D-alanine carboxypeptidase/D-alanyl-D-alanine-endopeptidase [Methylotenera sp.]|jgi:D-alanyl-D-alanine carboxypeptidase/D-alanyl-D-alanine-endopeptidase (penicillin-binding protein 4)|uniref:D-alanyl-D-alanine carboxypeptidase/D-alanyl-D-alanine endopeptidase n=1 Tax=Methylotenera sp. TaxID=2051956 RepID=UPI002725F07B|nr:D-alanyl-D-alanine carboxypeptidase/D-alanyl-D-alanine-endopeptidase [Methylotenera sp.]MDO9151755.1 D-alanyl-D-alanine carboxypeptidase/D-alanyl-D-alanine-endopeptidase [Methylotenera sp.]
MKRFVLFLGLIWYCLQAQAELPAPVANALKEAGVPQQNVSVYVQAVDSNVAILKHNEDKSMNPASVMKMVTTNAALDLLTPAYRWKTALYHDGYIKNWELNGNLMIKGYGDPSFKAQDFWRLLMSLRQAGVKKINGDLIIDKTYFADDVDNGISFDDEKWRAYNAKPSAFSVNGRSTSFRFSANDDALNVNQEFELPEVTIVNNMKTVKGDCGNWRGRMNYDVQTNTNTAVITFNGVYAPDCGERFLELSLFDDAQYAFFTFKKIWRDLGGEFAGTLKRQPIPSTTHKLLEQTSEPLGSVVRDINKWSNNLMARQLLLTIAAEKVSTPATVAKGVVAIKSWLSASGVNVNGFVLENGSGLSRVERISAEQLGKMLVRAYLSPVMPEFISSMPILSMDGTVKQRLQDSASNGRAHLKTGSINGVSSIAGYVLDANGHRHVMVMLVNHANAGASRGAQDALVEWVHQLP